MLVYAAAPDKKTKDAWRVDAAGESGEYAALFTGPHAKERATEYAAFKNHEAANFGTASHILIEPDNGGFKLVAVGGVHGGRILRGGFKTADEARIWCKDHDLFDIRTR